MTAMMIAVTMLTFAGGTEWVALRSALINVSVIAIVQVLANHGVYPSGVVFVCAFDAVVQQAGLTAHSVQTYVRLL